MGDVVSMRPANDDAPLYEQFADRVVAAAAARGLPRSPVAMAMLAKSVNELIEEDGPDAVAEFLAALAARLSTGAGAGHA